jgi:hypothetical protein
MTFSEHGDVQERWFDPCSGIRVYTPRFRVEGRREIAASDGSFVQTATTTHTDQLRERERESASNTKKLSEKSQQQQVGS